MHIRAQIATAFGIAKVGPTHVVNNQIESDGYKIDDVERALNVDAIQTYVGSDSTDMTFLWEALLAKAEGRELPTLAPHVVVEEETPIIVEAKPKGIYKKKVK